MKTDRPIPPFGVLLRELREETTTLLRQEVALAKCELGENSRQVRRHVTILAAGGAVVYAGTIVLLLGFARWLESALLAGGMAPELANWLSFVLVGGGVAVTGALALFWALRSLSHDPLAPRRTWETLRDDKAWLERKFHSS